MSDRPAITVLVPCRNEAEHIEACVASILGQVEPEGGFELLVVDGMSDDGTRDTLAAIAKTDARVRVIDNPRRTKPPALNLGLKQARGRYVAVLDAHNHYAPDYLLQCLAVLRETGAACVGGAVYAEGDTWLSRAICATHHSKFAVGNSKWHDPAYEGATDSAWGGFFDREVLEAVGAWDEELTRNQDDELALRITRAGHRIWQSARIKTWYTPRGSIQRLWQQYRQYGYWKVRVIQKHKLPSTVRQLVPAAFLATLGATALGGFVAPVLWGAGLGVAGVYVSASLAVSLATALRTEPSFLPVLPVLFACYHLGYGAGFLQGIWDFAIRKKKAGDAFAAISR